MNPHAQALACMKMKQEKGEEKDLAGSNHIIRLEKEKLKREQAGSNPHICIQFPIYIHVMTWIVHCKVRKLGQNVHSCIHWTSSLEQGKVQVEEDEGLPTHQIPQLPE